MLIRTMIFVLTSLVLAATAAAQDQSYTPSDITQVVMLGTGTPNLDPDRKGPSVAVVVNERPYIVEFGDGLVRQANVAFRKGIKGFPGWRPDYLDIAFLTHLHSDHTLGYDDLILTPWVLRREQPLEVYGPRGLQRMTDNLLEAFREDIANRIYGAQPANGTGWQVNVHEIPAGEPGVIYQDDNVKVEAFLVNHETWPGAYGYKFTTPDRVVVISGDTTYSENLIKHAQGADILVHEIYSEEFAQKLPPEWLYYHTHAHTSPKQLAEVAKQVQPKLLVLTHMLFFGQSEEGLLKEVTDHYDGKVVLPNDLDVF